MGVGRLVFNRTDGNRTRFVVLDPNGKLSTLLDDPEGKETKGPTNCTLGGPLFTDLYLAHLEADYIAQVHLERQGHPLYDRC